MNNTRSFRDKVVIFPTVEWCELLKQKGIQNYQYCFRKAHAFSNSHRSREQIGPIKL